MQKRGWSPLRRFKRWLGRKLEAAYYCLCAYMPVLLQKTLYWTVMGIVYTVIGLCMAVWILICLSDVLILFILYFSSEV